MDSSQSRGTAVRVDGHGDAPPDISRAKLRERSRPVEAAIAERQERIADLRGDSALDRFTGSINDDLSIAEQRPIISAVVLAAWV